MTNNKLTEKKHWDNYWDKFQLPVEIKESKDKLLLNEELRIFKKFLPKEKLSVLEIGGAPGQYLVYLHKQFAYEVSCLDYSEIGCEKTRENFKLLDIPVNVYHKDIFSDLSDMPLFDMVFSMGLIEHFEDVKVIIKNHLDLLKPGGIMILGMPNFRGINKLFLKRLAPELLKKHNLKTMNISTWKIFENELNIQPLFKGYVGGFEPATILVCENRDTLNKLLFFKARVLNKLFHKHFSFLRRFNSRCFSGYIMGVYRKP